MHNVASNILLFRWEQGSILIFLVEVTSSRLWKIQNKAAGNATSEAKSILVTVKRLEYRTRKRLVASDSPISHHTGISTKLSHKIELSAWIRLQMRRPAPMVRLGTPVMRRILKGRIIARAIAQMNERTGSSARISIWSAPWEREGKGYTDDLGHNALL